MKRKNILIIILLMVIGFAAVSTTLIINGTIKIGEASFDVIFSEAYVNDNLDNSIIKSDTSIEFTADLNEVGQEYTVDYVVFNKSSNYAADITLEYTGDNVSNYLSVTNDFDTATPLEAMKKRNGRITIKLTTPVTDDITFTVSYKLNATPVERDFTPIYEEEIAYLDSYEEELNKAINTLSTASDALGTIQNRVYILNDLINKDYSTEEERTESINSRLSEINNISSSANYNGKNLIDGSVENPIKVDLEKSEVYLPTYEINSTTLGLDGVADLPQEEAKASVQSSVNNLEIKSAEVSSVSGTLNSIKRTLDQKKSTLYRVDSDEYAQDELAKKAIKELLENIRSLQRLTYPWLREEGYYNNEISGHKANTYINAINLIVENTNFKGTKLLDGTYKDIPNLSTAYLGLNDTELLFDLSSKERVALTRQHLDYAVKKLKRYTEEDYKYMDDIIPLENEVYAIEDIIKLIQTTEGGLNEIHSILQRMNELQVQKINATNTEVDITAINYEENDLIEEIDRLVNTISWNKKYVMNGSLDNLTLEFGRQNETIKLFDFRASSLGLNNFFEKDYETQSEIVQNAIDNISKIRSYYGSLQNVYERRLINLEQILELLYKNKDEDETKKEIANITISGIIDSLYRMNDLLELSKNEYSEKTGLAQEATEIIRIINIMVEDAEINGVKLLNGTYNDIPSLYTETLGYNNTSLTFKNSTESDISATEKSIEYAINKVKSIKQ